MGIPAGEAISCTVGPDVAARLDALGGDSSLRTCCSMGSIVPGDAADRLTEPFDEDDAGPDDMVERNQGEGQLERISEWDRGLRCHETAIVFELKH